MCNSEQKEYRPTRVLYAKIREKKYNMVKQKGTNRVSFIQKGSSKMRIGIIGAGAIGLLMASRLNEKNDVVLFTRTNEQANYINENGITYSHEGTTKKMNVEAESLSEHEEELNTCDLIFITVKSYALNDLLPALKQVKKPIVFTQNGMAHVAFSKEISNTDVYFGVVEHGARRIGLNEVLRSGSGRIVIGTMSGLSKINFSELTAEDFPIIEVDNIKNAIESKLVVNTLVNPITAFYKVTNGELVSNEFLYSKMLKVFSEVRAILALENDALLQKTIDICRRTKENRSSMLQDVENGRETEIDAILGCVLKIASEKGIDAPMCEELYARIKDK